MLTIVKKSKGNPIVASVTYGFLNIGTLKLAYWKYNLFSATLVLLFNYWTIFNFLLLKSFIVSYEKFRGFVFYDF